jgi:hypothetical protein
MAQTSKEVAREITLLIERLKVRGCGSYASALPHTHTHM